MLQSQGNVGSVPKMWSERPKAFLASHQLTNVAFSSTQCKHSARERRQMPGWPWSPSLPAEGIRPRLDSSSRQWVCRQQMARGLRVRKGLCAQLCWPAPLWRTGQFIVTLWWESRMFTKDTPTRAELRPTLFGSSIGQTSKIFALQFSLEARFQICSLSTLNFTCTHF